ncbi:hypothetical protein AKJ65_05150 [candidate division MSBL1 archaeon SCGC-AAA259E19]|uniref:IS1 transposase n=2 Tax=candidate division MSBL1 TaxID=215777 RepID=A0A133UZL6_9EURY|nr:hypothetical protein AKJ65_05150 [candidate division MSBL1 archaeon SCGC-AAA259E19]KXA99620.1 hypothetical protein AKJ41_05130 [candidate division MSBL1 archaeon SCGC-AAA259O05]
MEKQRFHGLTRVKNLDKSQEIITIPFESKLDGKRIKKTVISWCSRGNYCMDDLLRNFGRDRQNRLHLAHNTGKRVQETADELIRTVKRRCKTPTKNKKGMFASDGNDQYTKALLKNFDDESINYGQLVKDREKGRVVGKTRTIIFGEAEDIETVHVERYNLTLRNGISRLIRKSLCFSKCKEMLDNHLDVYQCYNNLIRTNSALTIETKKGKKTSIKHRVWLRA